MKRININSTLPDIKVEGMPTSEKCIGVTVGGFPHLYLPHEKKLIHCNSLSLGNIPSLKDVDIPIDEAFEFESVSELLKWAYKTLRKASRNIRNKTYKGLDIVTNEYKYSHYIDYSK